MAPMATTKPHPPPGDLDLLIETERRLAARLDAAQAEALRIVEAARQAAREAERRLEEELQGSLAALRDRIAAEREAEIAAIAEEARGPAERLDGLSAERIADLAGRVLARLSEVAP